jgi:hypothetical protein
MMVVCMCVLCRKRADLLAAKQDSLVADSSVQILRNKVYTSNAQSDAFFSTLFFFNLPGSIYKNINVFIFNLRSTAALAAALRRRQRS